MIVGIDPGFSGAVAFLMNEALHVENLPLKKFMGRDQIDGEFFSHLIGQRKHLIRVAIIEDVSAFPNQGVTGVFRFGYGAGVLMGVLNAHNIRVLKVKPSVWKSALGLDRNKKKSLALAKKVFPTYKSEFRLLKDDGKAEAALLAHFAMSSL